MAYSAKADLVVRFGEREISLRTDRDRTGSIDDAVVTQAITDADGIIDSYLNDGGYTIPLSSVPASIARCSCDIARYLLYDDFRPDVVQAGYDRSMTYLEGVASGRNKLPGITPDPGERAGGVSANTRTMVYDDEWLEDYHQ